MIKPTVNTFGVTDAVFNLWSETNTWLAQYGVNQRMLVDPDNSQQLKIELGSSMSDMIDCNIDVYDMPQLDGAWSDWYSEYTIVIGPDQLPDTASAAIKEMYSVTALPVIDLNFDDLKQAA